MTNSASAAATMTREARLIETRSDRGISMHYPRSVGGTVFLVY